MSIAVLTQVFAEARRLTIAGSVVARGDFRLKKLLPPLEQAGKQAPVFAKVAEAVSAVIDGPEESSAPALLELTSLVTAVLYTQGQTGIDGSLKPVETVELGGASSQTSARVLKPLLEALSSTGSGRLELVKDAHDRGLFRDLRLVKPALGAIDDPYPEIAELIAEKVLPLYGKAILPELRAKYDPKGTKGHPRRLKLMHAVDPDGTRELVKAALTDGSKEVKVAAIACLGSAAEDLDYLIEQAAAKAQDVRSAAYQALARVNKPEAVAVLEKALGGKDYALAADAIDDSNNPKLAEVLATQVRTDVNGLAGIKEKKKVGEAVSRVLHMLRSFPTADHPTKTALLLDLFARRDELAKVKSDGMSGVDVNEAVVVAMARGGKAVQSKLVAAHADITPEELAYAFDAGRQYLPPAKLYDTFAPYLTAKVDEKKKGKDPAFARREAVIDAIESGARYLGYGYWHDVSREDSKLPEYDPRWLDLAVQLKHVDLVHALARPGHKGALAFAKAEFDAALKKAKSPGDLSNQLALLFDLEHPDATDAFFEAMAKRPKKSTAYYYPYYWFTRFLTRMSKDAIPRLEAMVAGMAEREADYWLEAIEELRTKK